MAGNRPQGNVTHLKAQDEQLVRLGLLAERHFAEDLPKRQRATPGRANAAQTASSA
jgi:hypothetical protein